MRISVVPEVCTTSEVSEIQGIAAKVTETSTSGGQGQEMGRRRHQSKRTTRKKPPKTRSKNKEPIEVASESADSEDQDLIECESNMYDSIV